jgi:N-methylhydantoinase B
MSAVSAGPTAEAIDPISYEVIRHKLWTINDEACTTLTQISGSPVVVGYDFNFGLYLADGRMAVLGVYYLIPNGTMAMIVKEILERYQDAIEPGDVFICSDPFIAAPHQNDVQIVAPWFHEDRLVGWSGCTIHQLDVGGMEAGSWCPQAEDVFQEGFRVPPVKLVAAGEVNDALWQTIERNSRMPTMLSMDFRAMLAGHRVAHARLDDLCDRYGTAEVVGTMEQMLEVSEEALRDLLRRLPDGTFRHREYLDHDGHTNEIYTVECEMTKRDDSLRFDFTGTSPQTPGFVNSTFATTLGAVSSALFAQLGWDVPWNQGLLEPVEMIFPPSSIINAEPPAPVSGSTSGGSWGAVSCAIVCISKLLAFDEIAADEATGNPDGSWALVQLSGQNQYGEFFADMLLDPLAGGGPAYRFRDGVDSGGVLASGAGSFLDVEMKEALAPLLYLWRRELIDSGGPGRRRGGVMADFAVTPYDTEGVTTTVATHGRVLPNCLGLFGGLPGGTSGFNLSRGAAEDPRNAPLEAAGLEGEALEAKQSKISLRPGDVLVARPQGGGGYGDPLLRDPLDVLADIKDRKISEDAAKDIYGVVLGADRSIDEAAGRAARDRIRARRAKGMSAPRSAPAIPDGLPTETLAAFGDALDIVRLEDGTAEARCAGCGAGFGDLRHSWKDHAARLILGPEDLGRLVELDPRMVMSGFCCPECRLMLGVELRREDQKEIDDMILADGVGELGHRRSATV